MKSSASTSQAASLEVQLNCRGAVGCSWADLAGGDA